MSSCWQLSSTRILSAKWVAPTLGGGFGARALSLYSLYLRHLLPYFHALVDPQVYPDPCSLRDQGSHVCELSHLPKEVTIQ